MFIAVYLLATCFQSIESASSTTRLSSGQVFGTVISVCHNVTYHTPPGDPYPTRSGRHLWLSDNGTTCLPDSETALNYCRSVYSNTATDHVIVDPFDILPDVLPGFPANASNKLKVYLCLGAIPETPVASTLTETLEQPKPSTSSTPHHLPSLIDVHRVYFAEQFHQLWNATRSNTSAIVDQLMQQTKGLGKLYQRNPELAKYTVSKQLAEAHQRLKDIWIAEEQRWSLLEDSQHQDLVQQLDSQDWAGENMFTFAMQESHQTVSRVEDGLAVLLSRLADSVFEEVRHLKAVHTRQPWMLRLELPTQNMTKGFTYVEQVHQALLKHVHVATMAINAFHNVMANHLNTDKDIRGPRYKPTLVASYDRLQRNLNEAQRLLNQVKSTLIGHLTSRMKSLLKTMNSSFSQEASGNVSVADWIASKHHAELGYIDLLVSQLLSPSAASVNLPLNELQERLVWRPLIKETHERAPTSQGWNRDHLFILLTIVLCSISLLSTFIFCLVRIFRPAKSSTGNNRRYSPFNSLLARSGHRFKQLVNDHKWISAASPSIFKVGSRVIVVPTDQQLGGRLEAQPAVNGYINPMSRVPC